MTTEDRTLELEAGQILTEARIRTLVGTSEVDIMATTLAGELDREALGLVEVVGGSGLGQPREDCWATCSVTGTRDMGVTTEAGEEDTTEAGEDGAEVIIEAGVVVEHQLDFRVDPRPRVEPGQLRDLVGPGGDRLDFC